MYLDRKHNKGRTSMFKYMEYVYAVYLNESFSKAAEELYISQPALSASIKKVEEEIGLPLFDRSSNPIQLTPAGEFYIETIEQVIKLEQEMRAHFDSLLLNKQVNINIGGASFFCTYVIPYMIQMFKLEYPEYKINTLEANLEDLIKNLRTGAVDLVIDVEKKGESKLFDATLWGREDILLAVPSYYQVNNKLIDYRIDFNTVARRAYQSDDYPKVCLKEFKDENMLLLRKGNDIHERSLSMCSRAGFTPNVTMYLDQMLTSYQLAKQGKGIAFIRAGLTNFMDETNQLFFYKIDDPNAYQNIMIYSRKGASLSKPARYFMDFITSNKFSTIGASDGVAL